MSLNCSFCNHIFTTKSSLNSHKKTAKYCLEIQNVQVDNSFVCEGCKANFTKKCHLERHIRICSQMSLNRLEKEKDSIIKNLEQTIEEQKQQIKDLQGTIEKLASQAILRPTSTTKNTQINYIQQLQPLTDDVLKDNVNNLTIAHILKGPQGYAEYALEFPLKDRIMCVDFSRRKIKFKDSEGNVITDPEMTRIATKFFQSIKDRNRELILEYGNQLHENFGENMDIIVQLMDFKYKVDRGAEGERVDFHHDFITAMCSKTIKD
jgi:hypothetical protein